MALKGRVLNQIINYLAFKLEENQSFQKLSFNAHEKIEGMRRATMNEFINSDPTHLSIRRLLRKLIESGRDFLKKS